MTSPGGKWIFGLAAVALLASAEAVAVAQELAGAGPIHVVGIARKDCDRLAAYIPDGEADYKPGVAADGSAVAPADLDGGYGSTPRESYTFPVSIDPFRGQSGRFSAHTAMEVANVTVDPATGRVTVDGQEITGADRALAEACAHLKDKSAP